MLDIFVIIMRESFSSLLNRLSSIRFFVPQEQTALTLEPLPAQTLTPTPPPPHPTCLETYRVSNSDRGPNCISSALERMYTSRSWRRLLSFTWFRAVRYSCCFFLRSAMAALLFFSFVPTGDELLIYEKQNLSQTKNKNELNNSWK